MKNKIKIIEFSAFAAFIIAVIISICSFETDCEGIRDEVLRLHVIANSDSASDQQLKLLVRDEILKTGKDFFSGSEKKETAEKKISDNISMLKNTAEKTIVENGFSYPVKVEVGKSWFPTKTYGDVTLPAGTYDAVRVIIGSGEGKNWWCVMFPPLCLPAAEKDVKMEDVLNSDELNLVSSDPKYEVRFWIIEKISELREKRKG